MPVVENQESPLLIDAVARKLVNEAELFDNTGSVQAANKFAEDWQSIVAAGPQYRDLVEHAAEKIVGQSGNPFVPNAWIENSRMGNYIEFTATNSILSRWFSSNGQIRANNDGSVRGMIEHRWPNPPKVIDIFAPQKGAEQ